MPGEVFPIVTCPDLTASRHFYELVLGGTESYRFPPEGDPQFVTLEVGAGLVGLAAGDPDVPAVIGDAVTPCVYVADLDRVVAAALAFGASVPSLPEAMPWGETVARIVDPAGLMLLVAQDPWAKPHAASTPDDDELPDIGDGHEGEPTASLD